MSSPVTAGSQTVAFIRKVVRELTASPGENQLTTEYLDETLNNFYSADFAYAIKLDQMKSVHTFYTSPYVDRYPLDVNFNQGVRAPVYVDGIGGYFSKDRQEFFRVWPKFPSRFQPITGDGLQASFSFTVPGPILPGTVTFGGTSVGNTTIAVSDDGEGNLQLNVANSVISVPAQNADPVSPGMYNVNTSNPGLKQVTNIGSINYVTGSFSLTFPVGYIPRIATQDYQDMVLWVSQYQPGKPYSILFWNNEFTIRPVPKGVHKIEVETYLTPVQFMLSSDNPILNQWAQYLAYGTSAEILRRRQDMEGLANVMEGFKRQEALVLERQGVEEIGQRNANIFSSSSPSGNTGFSQGFWV